MLQGLMADFGFLCCKLYQPRRKRETGFSRRAPWPPLFPGTLCCKREILGFGKGRAKGGLHLQRGTRAQMRTNLEVCPCQPRSCHNGESRRAILHAGEGVGQDPIYRQRSVNGRSITWRSSDLFLSSCGTMLWPNKGWCPIFSFLVGVIS